MIQSPSVRTWFQVFAVGILAMILGCAASGPSARVPCASCEEPNRFVRLQSPPSGVFDHSPLAFHHPFRMNEKEWEQLLRSIHVQSLHSPLLGPVVKGPVTPAWTDEEVRYLSETLSHACADATPEEWVVFGLTRPGEPGLTEITTGAWYVEGRQIHLRLANYRVSVTMPSIRKLMWQHPLQSQAGAFYELVAEEHHTLVADRDTFTDLFGTASPDLLIDPLAFAKASGVPGMAKPGQHTPSPSSGEIEARLNLLKRLREQGLITEEEYRSKKQQTLDSL